MQFMSMLLILISLADVIKGIYDNAVEAAESAPVLIVSPLVLLITFVSRPSFSELFSLTIFEFSYRKSSMKELAPNGCGCTHGGKFIAYCLVLILLKHVHTWMIR